METINFGELLGSLRQSLGDILPNLLTTLAILIIGWFIAVIVRAVIRRGLRAVGVNRFVSHSTSGGMDVETGVAKGAYWIIILMTLIAVFNNLDLPMVSEPLNALVSQVFEYLPKLISGGVLALVAWVLATLARTVATRGLAATRLDEALGAEAGMPSLGSNIGNILFWLIILLFLPAILGVLQLEGLLSPVQDMIDKILAMLPNIFAAGVIGFVGWLVARILRDLTANLLSATRIDALAQKSGMPVTLRVSRVASLIVFILVFVPALVAALNALHIEAISGPAINMLDKMMAAIPNIISAGVILVVTYFVARFAAVTLSLMLSGMGIDDWPEKLGVAGLSDRYAPSIITGKLVLFFAMLFAVVEAADMLGFEQVGQIVSMFIEFGGQILLGSVILVIGFWLANLAHQTILRLSGENSAATANIARLAIMGIVAAMGLNAMGIADEIVNLAFGLTLGAVAVAFALAFGLGGREAAGKQMEYWLSKFRE